MDWAILGLLALLAVGAVSVGVLAGLGAYFLYRMLKEELM
jgi:hypothetical protein